MPKCWNSLCKRRIYHFLDSDDYIENDMFEYMYTRIKDSGADMATCGLYEVYKDRIETQKEEVDFVCTGEEAFRCILRGIRSVEKYGIN